MTAIDWTNPPPSICVVPRHLFAGAIDDLPIRAVGVARLLSLPLHLRGELVRWLEDHVQPLEAPTPLRGGVWRAGDVRRALAKKHGAPFLQFVPPSLLELLDR